MCIDIQASSMSMQNLNDHNRRVVSSWWNRWHPADAGNVPESLDWLQWQQQLQDILGRENVRTKRMHLGVLLAVLQELDQPDAKDTVYAKWQEMDKATRRLEESQQAPDNWMALKDIIAYRDQLAEPADRLPPFQIRKRHFQWLTLCLYTMMPPIRSEWCDMRIVSYQPPDKTRNYLYRDIDGSFTALINKDKVSSHYGSAQLPLPPELTAVIKSSLELYPREHVFTNSKNLPIAAATYSTFINDIIPGKRVGIQVLRSAYITDFYNKHKSIMARKGLAVRMRHDRSRAELSYFKPEPQEETEEDKAHRKAMRRKGVQMARRLNTDAISCINPSKVLEYNLVKDGALWRCKLPK